MTPLRLFIILLCVAIWCGLVGLVSILCERLPLANATMAVGMIAAGMAFIVAMAHLWRFKK